MILAKKNAFNLLHFVTKYLHNSANSWSILVCYTFPILELQVE